MDFIPLFLLDRSDSNKIYQLKKRRKEKVRAMESLHSLLIVCKCQEMGSILIGFEKKKMASKWVEEITPKD